MRYTFKNVSLQHFSCVDKDLQSRQGGFSSGFSGSLPPMKVQCVTCSSWGMALPTSPLCMYDLSLPWRREWCWAFTPSLAERGHLHAEGSQGLLCAGGSSGRACCIQALVMCCIITCLCVGILLWVYGASPSSLSPPVLPGWGDESWPWLVTFSMCLPRGWLFPKATKKLPGERPFPAASSL